MFKLLICSLILGYLGGNSLIRNIKSGSIYPDDYCKRIEIPFLKLTASGFDIDDYYLLDQSNLSKEKYLDEIQYSFLEKTNDKLILQLTTPYTVYSSERYINEEEIIDCESNKTSSIISTIDLYSNEYNEQPYFINKSDLIIKGYYDNIYIKDLNFNINGDNEKYYLNDLIINIDIDNSINNITINYQNIHFTTGYLPLNEEIVDSYEHIIQEKQDETYNYYQIATSKNVGSLFSVKLNCVYEYQEGDRAVYTASTTKALDKALIKNKISSANYFPVTKTINNEGIDEIKFEIINGTLYMYCYVTNGDPSSTYAPTITIRPKKVTYKLLAGNVSNYDGEYDYIEKCQVATEEIKHIDYVKKTSWNNVINETLNEYITNPIYLNGIKSNQYIFINSDISLLDCYIEAIDYNSNISEDINISNLYSNNYSYILFLDSLNQNTYKSIKIFSKNEELLLNIDLENVDIASNYIDIKMNEININHADVNDLDLINSFNDYFLNKACCSGYGNNVDQHNLNEVWPEIITYFNQLPTKYRNLIIEASNNNDFNLNETLSRYDYCLFYKKYNLEDFLGRNGSQNKYHSSINNINFLSISNSDSLTNLIVIISSSMLFVFLSLVSFMVIRRKLSR